MPPPGEKLEKIAGASHQALIDGDDLLVTLVAGEFTREHDANTGGGPAA